MPAEAPVISARLLPNFRFIETLSVGHTAPSRDSWRTPRGIVQKAWSFTDSGM
jgi:hypothetical protein